MFEAICTYLSSSIGNINKTTRMRSFSLGAKSHKRREEKGRDNRWISDKGVGLGEGGL
jgi:hypothetical protein